MSARLSSSPALRLQIAESRLHRLLLLLAGIASLAALYLIYERGYWLLACALLPLAIMLILHSRKDSLAGCALVWRGGQWWLQRGSEEVAVELLPASLTLPWGIYLVWREMPQGTRRRAWLFPDCAPAERLRRLRVRLRLQH